jgi:hypothetical protein
MLYLRSSRALIGRNSGIYAFQSVNFMVNVIFVIDCGAVYRQGSTKV